MIYKAEGDLLGTDAEALVNTVNTVGVMGKGIALQFKMAFPDNYAAYEAACKRDEVQLGKMFVFHRNVGNPRVIVNFPTKGHWRGKSKIEDIESGLRALIDLVKKENIHSIAVPPLGCGNGGLDWDQVRPLIERAFAEVPTVAVQLFHPEGAPKADEMKIATKRPAMTAGRAVILELLSRYTLPGYRLTLLEIQKLAYFLQEAGEPLKLNFEKQRYGPYAENLHFVLQRMEGHFVRGYGDRSRDVSLELFPEAVREAEHYLSAESNTLERLTRVSKLIEGYETPYGLELLSTVHWVAVHEYPEARNNPRDAISGVVSWNEHKRKTFTPARITAAWHRLQSEGWF
ncbi:MAG: macro domain-containing protein [Candidatus Sulfotelmatobacter sp.]